MADGINLTEIKNISTIKLKILNNYLGPWATILGSGYGRLLYIDCYAGEGAYSLHGEKIYGSPIVAIDRLNKFCMDSNENSVELILIDKSKAKIGRLEEEIESYRIKNRVAQNLSFKCIRGDAEEEAAKYFKLHANLPIFLNVDPYGYPLSMDLLNKILLKGRKEIFLTFMVYQIIRDINNPKSQHSIDRLFGGVKWREENFNDLNSREKAEKLLGYFKSQVEAKYKKVFTIWRNSTQPKYFLLHLSNHGKAVHLMREVMWGFGNEEGTFESSNEQNERLFSATPDNEELHRELLKKYSGKREPVSFWDIQLETYELNFREKHYREVIKEMEKKDEVKINRKKSKRDGLNRRDEVLFNW